MISYHDDSDDIHINKSTRTCGLLNLLLTLDECLLHGDVADAAFGGAMRAAINLTSLYPGKSVCTIRMPISHVVFSQSNMFCLFGPQFLK